jgi:probable addiction module antidote protein/putative addiction module killer protein
MNIFMRTAEFDVWLKSLRDVAAKARVLSRIRSAEAGNFGDCESVGDGVVEMRIHTGPGFRVYFCRHGEAVSKKGYSCRQKNQEKTGGSIMSRIALFDAADYLDSEEVIAEYLNAALEDGNPDVFLQAVADVAKARGMAKLAKDAGLGRESLYKALAPGAKPRYDTVLKLLLALGVELRTTPAKPRSA